NIEKQKASWKKDVKETIVYIFLGVFLAFGINFVLGQALSTDMPVVAVESNSMVPTFSQGDILVVQGVKSNEEYKDFLKVGDIIVFSVEGRSVPIVHRIIEINPDWTYQTKGDANSGQHQFEKSIKPEQIHGKVIMIIPYLGWVKIGVTEYVIPFLVNNILIVFIGILTVIFLYLMFKEYR
ncbi:MAG: signal peptidase I, partial [Candidatus Aenigmatarchaeota archaeon]